MLNPNTLSTPMGNSFLQYAENQRTHGPMAVINLPECLVRVTNFFSQLSNTVLVVRRASEPAHTGKLDPVHGYNTNHVKIQ